MRILSKTLALALVLMLGGFVYLGSAEGQEEIPFVVYRETGPGNNYIPSGRMGDTVDLSLTYASKNNPRSGTTTIKVIYNAALSRGAGWVGLYWQQPANNWGNMRGGYDLSGASRLSFWARGETGGEIVEFKMGGIIGPEGDSDQASTGPVRLTKQWQEFTLDLTQLDLSNIIGGFCLAISAMDNPEGATFYLDDIIYE
jgi:hypothetical protein